MSSLAVRDALRAELVIWGAAQTPAIAFYDSINARIKPAEATWMTASFSAIGNDPLTFCGDAVEVGHCEVIVFSQAGTGDSDAVGIAGQIADAFIGFSSGDIEIESVEAPSDFTSGAASTGQYGVSVFLNYSYMK